MEKKDSEGNKLSENIGGGLNLDHFQKVKEARQMKSEMRFRISTEDKLRFREYAAKFEVSESEILRCLVKGFTNGAIKIK
tara:strand:- start:199 stop:438 length:240 start_codon:yes stop_codon:yes gene_type:complete